MAKNVHRFHHGKEERIQERFRKELFQAAKQLGFRKDYRKHEKKTQSGAGHEQTTYAQSRGQAEFLIVQNIHQRPGCRAYELSKDQIIQAHLCRNDGFGRQ